MKVPKNKYYILFGGIFVLANKLQAVADKTVGTLSTKQWFLLRNLKDLPENPPPTITLLAKETDTTRQNTAKMLFTLQKQGYVELTSNQNDLRSQNVKLTPLGKQALIEMPNKAGAFFEKLFADIPKEKCEIAAEVIIKMIDNLKNMQNAIDFEKRKKK